ncbi:hypothetical protein C8R45DRAFT_957499 [Mycena sanguinolenta]|nr:hypothetical protein C8R45DRAFT_957499 [Mycena sanguinolenta]
MELQLPTPRELELETLLRQRDTQLSQLNDEVTHLRQHVLTQLLPSTRDPVSLPPALTALLLPHLNPTPNASSASTSSSSTTAALTQRLRVLQEENDELYELLKQGETGKLKEEVGGLRRLVDRLNGALRESHQVVLSLSTELDKSYEAVMSTAPRADSSKSHSRSPRNSYHVPLPGSGHNNGNGYSATSNNSNSTKLPPTGPRAYKKPRLSSDLRASPPPASVGPPGNDQTHTTSSSTSSRPDARAREEQQPPRHADHQQQHRGHGGGKGNNNHAYGHTARMEVDEQLTAHTRSPEREREREREREPREKDKDLRHRDRERRDEREPRDRDGGRRDRRNNGNFGGGGGGRGGGRRGADRGPPPHNPHTTSLSYQGGDRTLKERLGL